MINCLSHKVDLVLINSEKTRWPKLMLGTVYMSYIFYIGYVLFYGYIYMADQYGHCVRSCII